MLAKPYGLLLALLNLLVVFPAGSNAASPKYTPPIPLETKEVFYPISSVAMGTVVLLVDVDEDGRVSEVKVLKSVLSLDEPSIRSAKQWKFEPAQIDGRRVRSKSTICFVYDRGVTPLRKTAQRIIGTTTGTLK
jgi:TonB family protein